MQTVSDYLKVAPATLDKLLLSLITFSVLLVLKILAHYIIKKRIPDVRIAYHYRRFVLYLYAFLTVLLIGRIWLAGIDSLTTFLGLASAGLAIAMHDTIANVTAWFFIVFRKPFEVGDRIQIGDVKGDVIDIRLFQFSLIEIGNWVDADQSTGRIIHVPNNKVLREPLVSYNTGFEYIWHEIPVLLTFESDWKKAREILNTIATEKAEHLSEGAQNQIRQAAKKYLIFYDKLTPIVYLTVRDSGVLLTIRYLVKHRQRRTTEQYIWEAALDAFAVEAKIDLAYPTIRYFNQATTSENTEPPPPRT